MPYIEEHVLEKIKTDLELEIQKNEFHEESIENEQKNVKKFQLISIILGVLALLGIIGTIYLSFSGSDKNMALDIKVKEEYIQTLEDSLQNLSNLEVGTLAENSDDNDDGNTSVSHNTDHQSSIDDEGITVYSIQIAAFEEKDLSLYSDGFVNFREIKADDYNKYALGLFETLEEAQAFRQELVDLGFERSFIASYRNGKRIQIESTY